MKVLQLDKILSVFDLILPLLYLPVIIILSILYKQTKKNIDYYKYFHWGIMARMLGAIAFALIYLFYYGGGDTMTYYDSGKVLGQVLFDKPFAYVDIMLKGLNNDNLYDLLSNGRYCQYLEDRHSYTVARFVSPFIILSMGSYIGSSILISIFCFLSSWKLYQVFCFYYPKLYKQLAIAILFMPSVCFWGSGILKDSITISCTCLITYSIFKIFLQKEFKMKYFFLLIISVYLLVEIKPYIFIVILPGSLIWIFYNPIRRIKNGLIKLLIGPIILGFGLLIGALVLSLFSDSFGQYSSLDKVLVKAIITHDDLTNKEHYGDNFYDIGIIDGTMTGLINKFPISLAFGLFGPFLWNVRNIVMFLSALENTFLLLLTARIIFSISPIKLFKLIGEEPIVMFALSFSIFFGFSVGLTSTNFGALVRYKIPLIPFYVSTLFIMLNSTKLLKNENLEN